MNFFLSRSILVFLLISLCYGFSTNAQEITANFLKERLQQRLEKSPIEKVHIHLDKPYYIIGDDIWFKAYVLDDGNKIPSLISGILYLDLLDQKNKIVKSLKLPLLNGVSWGGFKLPNTLLDEKYTLVAYTQWMKNAGPSFFFKQELLIKDSNHEVATLPALNAKDVDLQFFPESGVWIEDLPSKIAFKALNKNGLGESVSGSIFDNAGAKVVDFESAYLGMGQMSITPQADKSYYAKIKFKDNTEKTFNLPIVKSNGHQLTVNTNDPQNFIAKVFTSADLIGQQKLTLLVHQNGSVYLDTKIATEKQITIIPIKTANLPSGIVTLTVLDEKNLPICERIIFVNNKGRQLEVNLAGLAPSYPRKGKLAVDLSVALGKKAVQGSFSISTTNNSLVGVDVNNETHILSSLLLKSDLVGHIEKPNAYFTDNLQQDNERIDYLMLTQGWRKIEWNKVIENGTFKPDFKVETQLKISGLLLNADKPSPNTRISIISMPPVVSKDTVTDNNGRFVFDKLNFKEGTAFILKSLLANNNRVKFVMDTTEIFTPAVHYNNNGGETDIAFQQVFNKYSEVVKKPIAAPEISEKDVKKLKTVEIKGQVNKAPNSLNINGPGSADATFGEEDLQHVISLNQYLQGRVAGIVLFDERFYLTRSGIGLAGGTLENGPQPMVIYVDGAKIDETATLEEFSVDNIESVEVLKSPAKTFAYGTNDGVILITTKTANSNTAIRYVSTQKNPGTVTFSTKGFERIRKFYSPTYEFTQPNITDARPTVFWEPNLITDKDGNAKISYFNTDIVGTYRMVIEGIDIDGNLARKVITYEVK